MESLIGLKDAFDYLSENKWELKAKLVENVIKFMEKDNWKEFLRPNIGHEQKEHQLHQALEKGFIKAEQIHHLEEHLLGRWSMLFARVGFIFNIWEFFKGLFAEFGKLASKEK